jgi:DNA-binding response OmpR family regulator
MPRILVIEDEDKVRRALVRGLEGEGHEVASESDGEAGLARAVREPFDIVVLDYLLPGLDGVAVLEAMRAAGVRAPTLMLTALGALEDRVRGLDAGADDYLVKPFAWAELLARLRALLRRGPSEPRAASARLGTVEIDLVGRRLRRGEVEIDLTAREFELLEHLLKHKDQVVTRDQLAREVWRDADAGLTNVIDVYINYVRKKLDRAGEPGRIRTVRGIGYSLRADP